jgi:hypothetical protein
MNVTVCPIIITIYVAYLTLYVRAYQFLATLNLFISDARPAAYVDFKHLNGVCGMVHFVNKDFI